ncbi:MAG: hypothetical protein EBS97_05095 [Verrucomicrobia bacterium]|nr:hypothetical protein [Verrucomicrobiota bacterium]
MRPFHNKGNGQINNFFTLSPPRISQSRHSRFPAGFGPVKVEQTGLDEATAWKMKMALIGFTVAGLFLATTIMLFYSITREKAAETPRSLRRINT